MPDTRDLTRTDSPASRFSPPGEPAAEPRLLELARVASRTGTQDEFLIAPDKVVERFMDDFVAPVQEWCRTHADKVRSCYISVYEDTPTVFVIGQSAGYDFSLSRPLADLEMTLHGRGWSSSVLQLPPDNPSLWPAFFDLSRSLKVCPEPVSGPDHAYG